MENCKLQNCVALTHTAPIISRGPLLALGCGQAGSSPFWHKSVWGCVYFFFQIDISGHNRLFSYAIWLRSLFTDENRTKVSLENLEQKYWSIGGEAGAAVLCLHLNLCFFLSSWIVLVLAFQKDHVPNPVAVKCCAVRGCLDGHCQLSK